MPHLIKREPRNWKKDLWRSLSPPKVELIKFCRQLKITQTRCIAEDWGSLQSTRLTTTTLRTKRRGLMPEYM
jgi:hypothetical protein